MVQIHGVDAEQANAGMRGLLEMSQIYGYRCWADNAREKSSA